MKPRTWIYYCAAASLIGAFGVVFAIGFMTFVFSPPTGTFAPATSTDAAAWFQAAGSILAIVGSYHIGARQSAEARKQADARQQEIATRIKGYENVIEVVYAAGSTIRNKADENDGPMFHLIWQHFLNQQSEAAILMFGAVPLHELGSAERMEPAMRIRGCVQEMRSIVLQVDAWQLLTPAEYSWIQERIRTQGNILDSCIRRFRDTAQSAGE